MAIVREPRRAGTGRAAPPLGSQGPGRSLHAELCGRAARWLRNSCGCGVVITEMTSFAMETPDAIGWRSDYSVLLEAKTSRSDFLADARKPHRQVEGNGMGTFRFYLCPPGIIAPADLPPKWGLLYAREDRIERVQCPTGNIWTLHPEFMHPRNTSAEITLLVSALRRMRQSGGTHG